MDDNSKNEFPDIDWDEMAGEVRAHEQRARVIFENLHNAAEREEMTAALAEAMAQLEEEWLADYLLAAMMVFEHCDTDVLPILNKKKMLH